MERSKMGNKRLRPGDEVLIITGNEKGRTGKILSCVDDRVVVEGINVRKKHMKRTQQNQKGQIIDIECPIHVSNVMPSVEGKGVKLRARFNKAGEKELYYLEGDKEMLFRAARKPKG
jgi:large subunit ribosomal protein L24